MELHRQSPAKSYAALPALRPLVRWGAAGGIAFSTLALAWQRAAFGVMLAGRASPKALAIGAASVLAVLVLLAGGGGAGWLQRRRWGVGAALLALWIVVNAAMAYAAISPLCRREAFAVLFVGCTLWLFWLGWQFFVPWRWRWRGAVLAALTGLAVPWFLCVRIDGSDGDGRRILAWNVAGETRAMDDLDSGSGADWVGGKADLARVTGRDFPQFLGPERRGMAPGPGRNRLARAPRLAWRRAVGAGWGGFAVVGDYAVTQEQRGARETVVCYELASGRPVWIHGDAARFFEPSSGLGPRATPTIDTGRVYTVGATGILNCLDGATGRPRWSVDVLADNGAAVPQYGLACSPLVIHGLGMHGLVIVGAGTTDGRSLIAYDTETGKRVWSGGDDPAGYGSPAAVELAGRQQILILNAAGLAAYDPASGRELWTSPFANGGRANCSQPVVVGGAEVLVSSDRQGCELLAVSRGDDEHWWTQPRWANRNLRTRFSSVVARDGFIYGLDQGVLVCLDAVDGSRRWRKDRFGHGQLLLAGDLLLVQTERGEVVLVEPDPVECREVARFTGLDGKTWNPPALAGRYLVIRNDRLAACWEW